MCLPEKYRPQAWADVVGQPQAVAQLTRLRDTTGLGGSAYWIAGGSGRGKTTIALLIARELADDWAIEQLHPRELTPSTLATLRQSVRYRGFGTKGGRVVIVDEAHSLTATQVSQLLDLTEPILPHVAWVFTTTTAGQSTFEWLDDSGPLLSRCKRIKLAEKGLTEAYAARAMEIAEIEGLGGKPLRHYVERARQLRNNFRALLQEVELGRMLESAKLAVA